MYKRLSFGFKSTLSTKTITIFLIMKIQKHGFYFCNKLNKIWNEKQFFHEIN